MGNFRKVLDGFRPVLIEREITEDNRVSNELLGFYCRLRANQSQNENPGDFKRGEEEDKYILEMIKLGYAKEYEGVILIKGFNGNT